jgi:polyferredoxin
MDKMSYPRGLIRYTSERQLQGEHTHWLRPRIIGYAAVLAVMVGVFWYAMLSRIPIEITAIRDRNQLYVTTDSGAIDNIYTLQLANMDREMHEFEIGISGIQGAQIIGETLYTLDGGEVRSITLRVRVAPEQLFKPTSDLTFTVGATDMPALQTSTESRFMKPL